MVLVLGAFNAYIVYPGGMGGTTKNIYSVGIKIKVCAAVKGMVFKQFTLA